MAGFREQLGSWTSLQQAGDLELVRCLSSGNDDAFAVIVERYQRLVFSVAIRIVRDEAEAEEVVQIVFLDIFRNVAQFDPSRGTLKMWVLQYAYSRSVNRRRQLERRHFYSHLELDEAEQMNCSSGWPGRSGLSPGETGRLMTQALDHLSPEQRRAIDLVYFEGLEFPEAARQTGQTLESLRHHYYRGLTKIREFIQVTRSQPDAKHSAADTIRLEVANVKARTV